MYIKPTTSYYEDGCGQATRRQWFLILMQPDDEMPHRNNIRCVVRKVALHQCGHFMMGTARVFRHSLTLSGAYGADGLTKNVPRAVWERATPLPDELYDLWAHGGGWNGPGKERGPVTAWAQENFAKLAPKNATW